MHLEKKEGEQEEEEGKRINNMVLYQVCSNNVPDPCSNIRVLEQQRKEKLVRRYDVHLARRTDNIQYMISMGVLWMYCCTYYSECNTEYHTRTPNVLYRLLSCVLLANRQPIDRDNNVVTSSEYLSNGIGIGIDCRGSKVSLLQAATRPVSSLVLL